MSQQTKDDFLDGVTDGIQKLSSNYSIVFSWMDVAELSADDFYLILLNNADIGTEGYISIVSDTASFISTKYMSSQQSILRQRDKIFLMLSDSESPRIVLNTRKLFLYPRNLLIVAINGSYVELWTQKYNGRHGNTNAILLTTFASKNAFKTSASVYPNKLENLHGRPLKVASISYLPYIQSYMVEDGKGSVSSINSSKLNIIFEGTEAYLISEFCRLRNCKLEVKPHGPDRWGGVYKNGSSDGMIGSVYRKETELAIGCVYNWYNDLFDVSQYIAKSAVTILTPAPLRLQPYQAIILPFSKPVWALIGATITASSIIYHWLSKRASNRNSEKVSFILSSLRITAIFFQQSHSSQRFTNRAVRICVGSLLMATIILENSYTGKLKSLLTIPQYTKPIDTVLKFADSDLKWIAPDRAWILTLLESQILHEQKLVKKFEIKSHSESRALSFSKDYGVGVERLNSGLYSFGNYIQTDALNNLIVLTDNVYFEYTRAISIRGWPLMQSLNELILQTLEHGLIIAWEKKFVRKYLDPKTEEKLLSRANDRLNKPLPTILNLSHVSGIFLLLTSGYLVGSVSFLAEIIIAKISQRYHQRRQN